MQISDDNWKFLQNIKTKYKLKNLNEVLTVIKIHSQEAIKRGHLKFFKVK